MLMLYPQVTPILKAHVAQQRKLHLMTPKISSHTKQPVETAALNV